MSNRQTCRSLVGFAILVSAPSFSSAQNTSADVPPVIDVHVHAMDESFPGLGPMCPNTSAFTASDPAGKEAPFGWIQEECTPKLYPSPKGQYMKDVLSEMERLNVTAVVFGDPAGVSKWRDAAKARVIPGTSFSAGLRPGARVALEELRKHFTTGGFKVMGEIGLQYEGLSPSDPSVDSYFALAEELDVPVAIHMGTGGSGRANVATPTYRGSMGNPLLLEDLLARHPKLRVQVMHAGYPMIDNMLTLLQASSHVYVDVAGLIWSYPLTGSESLHRADRGRRVRRPRDVRDGPARLAEADGLLHRRHPERRLPDTRAEARHPLQQRGTFPEARSRQVSPTPMDSVRTQLSRRLSTRSGTGSPRSVPCRCCW